MASVLTSEQLSEFLRYIGLPQKYHLESDPPRDLAFLKALHIHTISTVPYENLSLHYSKTHTISTDPQDAFQKVVGDGRGRGGYCMELSLLFNHILRGLGFKAYTAGVRIRLRENGVPAGDYIGWVHVVNIVTLANGNKYMLDVGFGGDGATQPIPLIHDHPLTNLGLQENRLIHDHIPQQVDRSSHTKLWIYQYRNGPDKPWNSFYAFPELEFLEADFKILNWFTGSSPDSFQTYNAIVVKFLRTPKWDEEESVILGKRMLVNGIIKENLGGRTQIVQECRSEGERVEALQKHFGISLTAEEKAGIIGHVTSLD